MKLFRTALVILLLISHRALAQSLLPEPEQIMLSAGSFTLNAQTIIVTDEEVTNEAKYLSASLLPVTGLNLAIKLQGKATSGAIHLRLLSNKRELGDEGYALHVTPDQVLIEAAKPAGIFYGVQTLRQLLPLSAKTWSIPCMEITDRPRFTWRGFMLDVSRHYFDKQEVESLLDQMAELKMNVFHWHLTDDNGWRIEIKKYPKLTSLGAWHAITPMERDNKHNKDGRYGGFYTQDDIREVVAFAAARHIMIVPEVDIPGHCSAAMTAYPELNNLARVV